MANVSCIQNKQQLRDSTYIFILGLAFPFFDFKGMLTAQKVVIPCNTVRCRKHIKIHASPAMGFSSLQKGKVSLIRQGKCLHEERTRETLERNQLERQEKMYSGQHSTFIL